MSFRATMRITVISFRRVPISQLRERERKRERYNANPRIKPTETATAELYLIGGKGQPALRRYQRFAKSPLF